MGQKIRINASQPLTRDEELKHRQDQAMERQRRGMRTFTRPEVREAVMGGTQGEAKLSTGTRSTQVTYKKSKRDEKRK